MSTNLNLEFPRWRFGLLLAAFPLCLNAGCDDDDTDNETGNTGGVSSGGSGGSSMTGGAQAGGGGGYLEILCPNIDYGCEDGLVLYFSDPEYCTVAVARECGAGCVVEGARSTSSEGFGLCVGDSLYECTDFFCQDGIVYRSPVLHRCTVEMTEEECRAPCYAPKHSTEIGTCGGPCATDEPSDDPTTLCGGMGGSSP